MEIGQQQLDKSRVVKVESLQAWEMFINQANNQGCPVFVHFTASWCVPSLAMNPFVEEMAMNHQDLLFLLVDVDDVKEVASKTEIKAMPTFMLMNGGEVIDRMIGANPEEIRKRVDNFIRSHRSSGTVAE